MMSNGLCDSWLGLIDMVIFEAFKYSYKRKENSE